LKRSVLSRYNWAPLTKRVFITARWLLTPYRRIASFLPARGTLLDLGCGHGLFALAARDEFPDLRVIGIDHDPERIRIATRAASGDMQFSTGDLLKPPAGTYEAIALLDLMHYFSLADQERIFVRAYEQLAAGAVLLVREVDPRGIFNRVWERVMTTTGFTRTKKEGLHFRSPLGWTEALERVGFRVKVVPCSFFLFSDVLFVAEKLSA
jgi:trans-aconitate methyltransferase